MCLPQLFNITYSMTLYITKYIQQCNKKTIMPYAGNKGPDQTVHLCSLIKAFAVGILWQRALYSCWILYEPQHEKMYFLECASNEDSNQPALSVQSDQIFSCPLETLHPWLSKMHPVKILIRLCGCAGWSDSLLGAQFQRYVFWPCGAYVI